MATVQIPNRMFLNFLEATKHTFFRPGESPVPLGNHTLISANPVTDGQYNFWVNTNGREGEIVGQDKFVKQQIHVNRVVIQELVNFDDDDVRGDGYASKLEALSDMQQDDNTLSLNSAVTLVRFTLIIP